nr:hypothetical protein [Tanacetum cinerariifolium]
MSRPVIKFGDSYVVPANTIDTTSSDKSGRTLTLTAEDMQRKKNDVKARTSLLLSLPDEHQLRFKIEKDDLNQKLLTSLAPEWLMHTIVWRNRSDLDTMSLDDLYNHLKVYESEVQKKPESNSQNIAFISSAKHSSGKEDDKFWKKTRKKISIQGSDVAGFDKSKVECFNSHKMGHLQESAGLPEARTEEEETTSDREDHALVADEVAHIEFALTANTSAESKVFDNSLCLKDCKKNNDSLNSKITDLTDKLFDVNNFIYHYKLALAQVESRLIEYKEREVKYIEKIKTLEYYNEPYKESNESLKKKLETLQQEKEGVDGKLVGLLTASKNLDNLTESQRPSSTIKSTLENDQNRNTSVSETVASPITSKPFIKFVRPKDSQSNSKTDKKETPKKPPVKYVEQYRKPNMKPKVKGNQRNWNNLKSQQLGPDFVMKKKAYFNCECIVLGRDFKLLDDANILLRTPRQHNMYSIDLNNIIPHRDLTCLVAKASADECMLWHRRLEPKDLKVKSIRCDNEGEFRNKEMNDFCLQKRIKREFSNARTPQQNGVAERRNRTLIEAARIMFTDAKLPVTFWAEAVNTACYVQNRVLVNKSHNKTPYELFNGRSPAIGFLKPFGCHVMILNTLDNLGKFKEKGDEGYFIGYSMSSKAFRVFNKRPRRVDENMYVEFLENKAIEKGTKDAARQEVKKDVSSLRYIALPNWAHDALLKFSSSQPQDHCSTKVPEGSGNSNLTASTSNPPADQMETLTMETSIPTVSSSVPTAYSTDSQEPSSDARLISKRVANQAETPSLENILSLSNRFEDILRGTTNSNESNGEEADISNMEATITASPTPTLRIHKDHSKSQIIGPVDTPIQTRNKSKKVGEQSFIAIIHQKTDPTLLQFYLFSCFLSQVKPKKISDAIQDLSWDLEFPAKVYKVEKAMYGLHQAPRAWYGTLLKYLLKNGFQRGTIDQTLFIRKQREDFILIQVYVDDIIFGSSNPQLCREFKALMHEKFQMSAMGEFNFFLCLQVLQKEDGIFLSQDKYVGDILEKFGYTDVRSSNTPMDKENPWGKDETRKDVDLHLYRSMIGSLMYLTASRPNIMFAICACARHQVTPKEYHLHAVKRIFRYLKGHLKLGIWRLISWQCKKQTIMATSTTEAEYVAAASCCGQVLLSMPCEALSREYSTSILRLLHTAKTFDLVWIWLGGDYGNVFLMGFDGIQ